MSFLHHRANFHRLSDRILYRVLSGILFVHDENECFVLFWLFKIFLVGGLLFVAVHRRFTMVVSLVAEHQLNSVGSVVAVHGLSCSAVCGIFPDQ